VDELLIIASPRHPLALKRQVTLDDLRTAEWLLREPGSGTREEVEQLLLRHLHNLAETRQIGSSEAIKHTLAQGIGISCLSRWVVGDLLDARRLIELPHALPMLTRRFFLIRHRDKFMSPGLGRFWESCSQFANPALAGSI
jgi:DNA-binding transcriptional LysR family regulator